MCIGSSTSILQFVCRWLYHQAPVNMDRKSLLRRSWIFAMVTLATSLVGMAVALTPDGLALMEFKHGLNVASPLLQNWNPLDTSPCSWGGINCMESGDVRSLNLSAQDPMLEGHISSSLGKLKSLEVLMLDQNLLSGSIPPALGNLSSLVTLFLYENRLSGEIPPQLGNCRSLVTILLYSNRLSGEIPPQLGNCRSLTDLQLDSNILSGNIPESLGNLKNLTQLWLGDNMLTGDTTRVLEVLSRLPAIEFIFLGSNSFNGTLPPSIGNATTLTQLALAPQRGVGFGGQIPKELGKLVNLTALNLWGNNFTGEIPPELGNMTSLNFMSVQDNKLKGTIPSSLGSLVNLTVLDLSVNNFTGEIPPELGNLVNLKTLQLHYNSISGPIPTNLTSLINLTYLALSYMNLTGPIPTNMSKFTALERLQLQNNTMSGPIPEDFGRFMSNLTVFNIGYNAFNGTLPAGLCQGGKLKLLLVESNKFHGDTPLSLASCQSLTLVRLSHNQFTSIPQGFGSNSSLESLDVSHNQLTGQLPTELGTNSHLAFLDLSENWLTGDISILQFSQLTKNLSVLNLARNNFTGEIPAAVGMCNLLFRVDLSYNSLNGTVPPALANLSSLQMLHLQGNNLRALHPSIYSGFASKLRSLNLAENPWNAPIASEIGSLKELQTLNLSYGGLTGSIPSILGQLTQLEVLDLSHNNLTGEVPSALGELMISLTSVNISFNHLTGSLPPAWMKFLVANPSSFSGNPDLCLQYNANNVCLSMTSTGPGGKVKLSVGVILGVVLGIALVLAIFAAFLSRWHGPPKSGIKPILEDIFVTNLTKDPLPFTFEEIMVATENLSDAYIIGRGGHGVVYKVAMASCAPIVVKKIVTLDMKTALLHKSFWSEVGTIGQAKHRNLVRLLGFIKWGEVGLILYDFVSNGDLHAALHMKKEGHGVDLTWKARLCIAEGVAHGLAYLHHDFNPPIVHRDIKSSNVLLDDDLEAHISDFGLAKLLDTQSGSKQWLSTSNILGTYGYIAPEVGYGTLLSPYLDIYSYGVLLLELITGKQPIDPNYGENLHIVPWVMANVSQNEGIMSESILDPSLLKDPLSLIAKEEMLFVQKIALMCVKKNPANRPTMREVANMLQCLRNTTKKNYKEENVKESLRRKK